MIESSVPVALALCLLIFSLLMAATVLFLIIVATLLCVDLFFGKKRTAMGRVVRKYRERPREDVTYYNVGDVMHPMTVTVGPKWILHVETPEWLQGVEVSEGEYMAIKTGSIVTLQYNLGPFTGLRHSARLLL